jgi:hypothetical protein
MWPHDLVDHFGRRGIRHRSARAGEDQKERKYKKDNKYSLFFFLFFLSLSLRFFVFPPLAHEEVNKRHEGMAVRYFLPSWHATGHARESRSDTEFLSRAKTAAAAARG